MANAVIAVKTEEVSGQLATYGGSFGTGVLLGWVATKKPAAATAMCLATAAVGAFGAMMTGGFPSQMLEGVGAAAMGALGASLPTILAGTSPASRVGGQRLLGPATNIVASAIARNAQVAKQLAPGRSMSPTAVYVEEEQILA